MVEAKDRIAILMSLKRHEKPRHIGAAQAKVFALRHSFEELKRKDHFLLEALLPQFPIGLVTAIEVYFRLVVAELIDHGSPYSDRSEGLTKHVRFDLAMIQALQGRKITIGEVISQVPSLQSLSAICNVMETLTGEQFLPALSKVRDRFDVEICGKPDIPIVDDIESLAGTISKLMKIRHVLVHELRRDFPCSIDDVMQFFEATDRLFDATFWYASNAMDPAAPLQQQPMNIAAGNAAAKANSDLELLVATARSAIGANREADFDAAQAAWRQFRNAKAEFDANQYRGGSIRPMIYATSYRKATELRISELQDLCEEIEHSYR